MALQLATMVQFSEPQMGEPTGLVKQATHQITLTEFLSRMPIRALLLDQTAPFSGRRMVGTIGSVKPVQFPLTFTTLLSQIQIPGPLLVLSV